MKLEHYVFFSLILAAAIVTGSTLGILLHFPQIAEQVQVTQLAAKDHILGHPESVITQMPTPTGQPSEARLEISTADNCTTSVLGHDVMLVSAGERKQIVEMLKMIGMAAETDLPAFIKNYQQKYSLEVTGLLDSKTLHYILEEAKLKQAFIRQGGL